jgi:tetratricopeptide (TPR) repeat protein/predicted Ser/Thr protein kinase
MSKDLELLFCEVADLTSEARERYFAERQISAEMRAEIESLLAFDTGRLSGPNCIGNVAEQYATVAGEPAQIGQYRILSRIGEGGMGVVYQAEQASPRRVVALKLIKPAWSDAELQRRFEREAQALGRLHHPGIAQIYEAATADTGFGPRPYFAMEFIKGQPLGAYAQTRRLSVRERLELVASVCDAVHHAHQKGIIHRDLKPGNILVDETGQPKVLDFGVARVTDSDAHATQRTDVGEIIGTLAYMSPEQVLADPLELDTRSDVYALGVNLYELLAGYPPYALGNQLHEALRTIREADPKPLSAVSRSYRGDVETIVAKALEKDKSRRYASAADLGADIRRYLDDEPIAARPPSAAYQLHKFARRHRPMVVGVAAVFVVLLAGIVASTLQAMRADRASRAALVERDRAAAAERETRKERDRSAAERNNAIAAQKQAIEERNRAIAEKRRADEEAATAQAVRDFLQNDLLSQASAMGQARPGAKPDPDLKVRTALDQAAARIPGKLETRPLVEAAIRQTIATAYNELGLYAEALPHAERAVELRRREQTEEHPATLTALSLLANLYIRQGKFAQAEVLHSRVLKTRRRVLGEEHPDTFTSLDRLAAVLESLGRYAEAEVLHARELAGVRRLRGEDHQETVRAMGNLALDYTRQGKYAEAEPLNAKALDILRRLLGDEHPRTLIAKNNLAQVYMRQSKFVLSERLQRGVVSVQRRLLGEENDRTLVSMSNLAVLYIRMDRPADAEALLTSTVTILRRTLGEEHPNTLLAMNNLASAYSGQGKLAQAAEMYTQTLKNRRRALGEWHPNTVSTTRALAMVHRRQDRYADAEALMAKVVDAQRRSVGPEHARMPEDLILLAEARVLQRKYEVESLLREAIGILDRQNSKSWVRDYARSLLGVTLTAQRQYGEAEALLLEAYDGLKRRNTASGQSALERSGAWIVQLYREWGKPDQATQWQTSLERAATTAATEVP